MTHRVEPLLPLNITEATFLIPDITKFIPTHKLLAVCAWQLAKQDEDLAHIHECVLASRYTSVKDFEHRFSNTIKDWSFRLGKLVLVLNKKIEPSSNVKCKPCYFGPMVVILCSTNGIYHLTEVDGYISRLKFAAFHLIPYHSHLPTTLEVTHLIDADMDTIAGRIGSSND